MIEQTLLSKLNVGDKVNHYLLITKYEKKLTAQKKEFLRLEIADKSTIVDAFVWDRIERFLPYLTENMVVYVQGVVGDFNGKTKIDIEKMRRTTEEENISPDDFLPKSLRSIEEMRAEFYDRISKVQDKNLKLLLNRIFREKVFSLYSRVPAGKQWHHAYISGLLEHTLEIVKICDLVATFHEQINNDLLVTGAFLHDLGKIEEIDITSGFTYSNRGKLLGHIVIAALYVNDEVKSIPDFPDDLRDCVLHLILSHQGKLEFASPVVPKTIEAIALYHADELSAKVNAYKNELSKLSENAKWTKFVNLAATDIFNHNIKSIVEEKIEQLQSIVK